MKKENTYSKSDFNEYRLPKNRKEQFFDILKNRKLLLFKIGLLSLLFSLIFIAIEFIKDNELISISSIEDDETYFLTYYNLMFLFESIKTICYFVFAVLFSGLARIFKRLIWDEPVIFMHDFKLGIKENIRTSILFASILFILKFGILFSSYAFSNMSMISYVIYGFEIVILVPLFIVGYFVSIYYKNSLSDLFKNSFKIYLLSIIPTLLKTILVIGVIFFYEIASSLNFIVLIIKFALLLIVPLIFLPIFLLICFTHQASVFDKLINKDNYIEYYRKGLYKEDKK